MTRTARAIRPGKFAPFLLTSKESFMTRLTMVLVAFCLCLTSARGSLTPTKERSPFAKPPKSAPEKKADPEADPGLVISDETEVQLDGRACKYEDIPETAEVVLLELAKDQKAVLKIHFRTKKAEPAP